MDFDQDYYLHPRFNFMANNLEEVLDYYHHRATQLLSQGWSWDGNYINYGWGIEVHFKRDEKLYESIFILKKGQGHLSRWFREKQRNFITMTECYAMYDWLESKQQKYTLATPYTSTAYAQIATFYRDRHAERSHVPYMNHIDEGLYILKKMGASKLIWDAYCLHPIFQNDSDLTKNWNNPLYRIEDSQLAILSLEYRNIANAYLAKRTVNSIDEINLSPIEEVNQMLWADKIQNRKDFEKYHLGTHPNSEGLKKYFQNWFEKLGISDEFYRECVEEISIRTGSNFRTRKD